MSKPYVYRLDFSDGTYYYGCRVANQVPWYKDSYLCSGRHVQQKAKQSIPCRTLVAEFLSKEEAFSCEQTLIASCLRKVPNCLNLKLSTVGCA